jgi:hypothetical protein
MELDSKARERCATSLAESCPGEIEHLQGDAVSAIRSARSSPKGTS